jgi:hypothetical protein
MIKRACRACNRPKGAGHHYANRSIVHAVTTDRTKSTTYPIHDPPRTRAIARNTRAAGRAAFFIGVMMTDYFNPRHHLRANWDRVNGKEAVRTRPMDPVLANAIKNPRECRSHMVAGRATTNPQNSSRRRYVRQAEPQRRQANNPSCDLVACWRLVRRRFISTIY